MRCLLCNMQSQSGGKPCKLCGIRSKKPFKRSGFYFCCGDCARHFGNIIAKTPAEKLSDVLRPEVMI